LELHLQHVKSGLPRDCSECRMNIEVELEFDILVFVAMKPNDIAIEWSRVQIEEYIIFMTIEAVFWCGFGDTH
jgi:hypothetical protein